MFKWKMSSPRKPESLCIYIYIQHVNCKCDEFLDDSYNNNYNYNIGKNSSRYNSYHMKFLSARSSVLNASILSQLVYGYTLYIICNNQNNIMYFYASFYYFIDKTRDVHNNNTYNVHIGV